MNVREYAYHEFVSGTLSSRVVIVKAPAILTIIHTHRQLANAIVLKNSHLQSDYYNYKRP